MKRPNGMTLWQGPSILNGQPIAVVATGLRRKSKNRKTGPMIQIWIIPQKGRPSDAQSSVCGDCKHGPQRLSTCYVDVPKPVRAVCEAYRRGAYPPGHPQLLVGDRVRIGAWGDPAAVPAWIWSMIARCAKRHTGYTHQWKTCDQRLRAYIMASVDHPAELELARAMGWRTFRPRPEDAPLQAGEIACPASGDSGAVKSSCYKCALCDGHKAGDKRKSITIVAHGARARPFVRWHADLSAIRANARLNVIAA